MVVVAVVVDPVVELEPRVPEVGGVADEPAVVGVVVLAAPVDVRPADVVPEDRDVVPGRDGDGFGAYVRVGFGVDLGGVGLGVGFGDEMTGAAGGATAGRALAPKAHPSTEPAGGS